MGMTPNPGTGRCWNCRSWREYWSRHSWREYWNHHSWRESWSKILFLEGILEQTPHPVLELPFLERILESPFLEGILEQNLFLEGILEQDPVPSAWNRRSWKEYWNRHSWRESWRKSPSSAGITIPRWNTGITILGGDPGANPCSQYFPVTPGPPWITMDHSRAGNTGNTQWCPDAGWRRFPDLPKQFLLLLEKPGAFPAFSGKHNPCWVFQPLSQGNPAALRAPSSDWDEGWLGTPGLGITSRRDPKFCCGAPKSLPHTWLRLRAAPSQGKAAWDYSRNSRRDGTCLRSRCQLPHPPCRIFRAGKGNVRPSLPSPAAPAPGKQRRGPSIPFSTSLECRRPGWSKLG